MNKYIFELLFLTVLVNPIFGQTDFKNLEFVGYYKNNPVFDDYKNHVLSFYDNGLTKISAYPEHLSVIKVRDSTILMIEKDKNSHKVLLKKGESTFEFILPTKRTVYLTTDFKNTIYYTDKDFNLKSSTTYDSIIVRKAVVVDCIGDNLYYSVDISKNENPEVAIYKMDIKTGKKKLIIKSTSGEDVIISDDEKWIFDKKLRNGQYKSYLFNVENGSEKFIKTDESLVFYHPNRQSFFRIENGKVLTIN